MPATGVVDYQYFPVPTNFTEDKWVEVVEVRPGDRSVVHHAIVVTDSADGYAARRIIWPATRPEWRRRSGSPARRG